MDSLTVTSSMLPQYLGSIHAAPKVEGADHPHPVALHNMEPAIGSFVPWTDGSVAINSSDPFTLKSEPESQTGDVNVSGPLVDGGRTDTEAMFSSSFSTGNELGQRFTDLEYCQSIGTSVELVPSGVGVVTPTQPTPSVAYVPAVTAPALLTSKGQPRSDLPLPPKKPLSPYMRFSKGIWQQVKTANPGMSVCEVGATIGRIWRELDDARKQQFIEEFNNDKVRYDTELQSYLRTNGLQASDLIKPRAKKTAKDPSPSKKSKSHQQQPKPSAPPTTTTLDQPSILNHSTSVAQPAPSVYHGSEEVSMVLPSFGQVWSNADQSSHRDLLAQVVYDSHLHDEREGNAETENPNPIFSNQTVASGPTQIGSDPNVVRSDQNINVSMPNTTASNNWWWTTESHATSSAPPGRATFAEVGNPDVNKTSIVKTEVGGSGEAAGSDGGGGAGTVVDAEKLFLRGALVEKTQEVVQLMRELEQAYGLIHRLKQQNDFFIKWYHDQRSGTTNE